MPSRLCQAKSVEAPSQCAGLIYLSGGESANPLELPSSQVWLVFDIFPDGNEWSKAPFSFKSIPSTSSRNKNAQRKKDFEVERTWPLLLSRSEEVDRHLGHKEWSVVSKRPYKA